MRRRRIAVIVLLGAALSGCQHEPTPYESLYTAPPSTPPPPPSAPLPPGVSFVDDFNRPMTPTGIGSGWLLGPADGVPSPASTEFGFIQDGHLVANGDTGVYALRMFRNTVRRVGVAGRWSRSDTGGFETVVIGVPAEGEFAPGMVRLTINPFRWALAKRRGSESFESVVGGKFNPPLEVDREHRFEIDTADGTVTVRVPGTDRKYSVGTRGLLSKHAFWQVYSDPTERPIGTTFSINTVWVAEQNQPLSPLPGDKPGTVQTG